MLTANKGMSLLGASVAIKFSQQFANEVSWQKIDERTGMAVEDEEDITRWSVTATRSSATIGGGGSNNNGGENEDGE